MNKFNQDSECSYTYFIHIYEICIIALLCLQNDYITQWCTNKYGIFQTLIACKVVTIYI